MRNEPIADLARLNWIAILSFAGSVAVSLGIWIGLFRVIEYFNN